MELLLPDNIILPNDGSGVIAGFKVQNGKYLVTHFIETGDSEQNLSEHCFYITNRLFGGIRIVGCYNCGNVGNKNILNSLKRFFKAEGGYDNFVSIVIDSGIVVNASRYNLSNQTSKSDIKKVTASKYPLVVASTVLNVHFEFAIDNMDFSVCIDQINEEIKRITSNTMISINGHFLTGEQLIFPKNSKNIPSKISPEIFLLQGGLTRDGTVSNTSMSFECNTSLFCVVSTKSTHNCLHANIIEDLRRTLSARLDIIEDQVEAQKIESNEGLQTIISSFELPKRINYPLENIPVSIYEGISQRASDDLLDFFSVAESSKLFEYPEEDIIHIEEIQNDDVIQKSKLSYEIITVIVLIISIIIAIVLQS